MFVLQQGTYPSAKLEYSYGRRSQGVVKVLHWKDVAMVEADSPFEAVAFCKELIEDWAKQGYKPERFRLEGRGKYATFFHDF